MISFFGLLLLLLAVNCGLLTYRHLHPEYIVEGVSMLPTLQEKEIVQVASHEEPARFDIVVLHPPDDAQENYVKRVIGLPGERLRYRDGELFINEKLVKDSFAHLTADFTLQQLGVDQIPEGYYFVLGDNREVSQDSRYFGLVPASKIVGIIRG